jgi:hypothetical protein
MPGPKPFSELLAAHHTPYKYIFHPAPWQGLSKDPDQSRSIFRTLGKAIQTPFATHPVYVNIGCRPYKSLGPSSDRELI